MSFVEKWKADIWPVVEKTYTALLQQRPAKQDTAMGTHYDEKVYEILSTKKEVWNVSCNFAWTNPVENTNLQGNISMATVERFALDLYVDTTAEAAVAGSAAAVAGSAATVAGSAAAGEGVQHNAKVLLQTSRKTW